MPRAQARAGAGPCACTALGLRTRVRSSSASPGRGPLWSASVVWPCSSRTTIAVRGKRCSCSTSCSARARASAVAGRAAGSFDIASESSRSSETGTSARPVLGTGLERMRGMRA